MKPNITIASNIYVRSSGTLRDDGEFVKNVAGHKALKMLKARLPRSYGAKFSRIQIEEMRQNVVCRHGKNREHAYGKALVEGKVEWSCRCENADCRAYEKCMNLPFSLKIVRTPDSTREVPIVSANSTGFDCDSCSFEPPIVKAPAIVVPAPALPETQEAMPLPVAEMPDAQEAHEIPKGAVPDAPNAPETPETPEIPETPLVYPCAAERFRGFDGKRVLVLCENAYEAGYFSTILYKNKVKHRQPRPEGYTLNRRIADMFWDYCGDEIYKDGFMDRCLVRTDCDESGAEDFYDALYALCGVPKADADTGALVIPRLADALNASPELISECVLNIDDANCPITVSTLELLSPDEEYDEVVILAGEASQNPRTPLYSAVENLFGSPPLVILKERVSEWVFGKSMLGRPCRISLESTDGAPGRRCLNVELGLWGDVDGRCFLNERTGDSVSLQLYIAEKIAAGDPLTVEKSSVWGGYWLCHDGNPLGEFPESIVREVRAVEGFPPDFAGFEGVYVRNIVTCVAEKDDQAVPARFRGSRIWLGLEITGYAKVLI